MFGFIYNLFKPKSFKEVKKEYKQAKTKWIDRTVECREAQEFLESQLQISKIEGNIIDLCFGGLRPDQAECPPLIIYNYKKLLEIDNEAALVRATNILKLYLTETQQQDFMNKVSNLKEYKEWKLKQKLKDIDKDFV